MKKFSITKTFVAFLFCVFVIDSCSKNSYYSNNECNFSTESVKAPSGSQVTYSATGKGGTTSLSSVSYQSASGPVNVSNPSLPWSVNVNFPSGGTVALTAYGTASNGGTIMIEWTIDAAGNIQADSTSCGY